MKEFFMQKGIPIVVIVGVCTLAALGRIAGTEALAAMLGAAVASAPTLLAPKVAK